MNKYIAASCRVLLLLILCVTTITPSALMAQNKTWEIKGVVVDSNEQPVLGAVVCIVDTNNAAISNIDGEFSLKSKKRKAKLEVTSLGYATQIVEGTASEPLRIVVQDEVYSMDAVVKIGYGAVRKSDLSGSVSSFEMKDEASTTAYTSVDQILQGRIAGVNIISNSGAPGAGMDIQIRGTSTVSGDTSPLYVIDGFPMETDDISNNNIETNDFSQQPLSNPLSTLNPNDIESIQILKDASATAIYGSRATNGVILITTKQGEVGRTKITYSARFDASQLAKKIDMLDSYEYCLYKNELDRTSNGYTMDGLVNPGDAPRFDSAELEMYKVIGTDWQDLIYKPAYSMDHKLDIKGGGGKANTIYSISGGYTDQTGIIANTGLERYSIRGNFSTDLYSNLKLRLIASHNQTDQKQTSHSQSSSASSIVRKILVSSPTTLPGDVYYDESEYDDLTYATNDNPYTLVNLYKDENSKRATTINANLDYKITESLSANVSGGAAYSGDSRRSYLPNSTNGGSRTGGTALCRETFSQKLSFESMLNYNRNINRTHRINAVAGFTFEDRLREAVAIEASNYPGDDLSFYSIQSATDILSKSSSYAQTRLLSFLSRVNYTLKNKYIFTATGRYDGSSILAKGNQWSFFPSGAFAWRVNQEEFLKSEKWLSNFKLRASYGITGSQSAAYTAAYSVLNVDRVHLDGEVDHAVVLGSLGNTGLGWESTNSANVGFDFGIIDNRFRITFDAYDRRTKDMIVSYGLPTSLGYGTIITNLGVVGNRGLELELGGDIIVEKKFQWSLGGNISVNRNEVLELGDNELFGTTYISAGSAFGQSLHITKEGYPIGSFWGYVVDGVYQNEEEAANAPYDDSRTSTTPGSLKYRDISGPDGVPDGKITSDDKTIIGSAEPDFTYGINTNFTYDKITLSLLFTGRQGGNVANMNRYATDSFTDNADNISQAAWDGRWQGEGTSNYYPAVDGSNSEYAFDKRFSTFLLEDGSFFKLKSATLAWRHAPKRRKVFSAITLSLSATNIFCLSDYSGYDPEVSATRSALSPNVDYGVYPSTRTYSVGFSASF